MLLQSVELPAAKGDAVKAMRLFDKGQMVNADLKHKLSHMMDKCAVEAGQTIVIHSELKVELAELKRKNLALKKHCDQGIQSRTGP